MTGSTRWAYAVLLLTACPPPPEPEAHEPGPPRVAAADRGSIVELSGAPRDPLAGASEGPTVLLFVATDCPIANRYAPTMQALSQAWAERGVTTWLVYPDPDDDPEAIGIHQAAYALTLPTVRDPKHVLVDQAGARVTPEAAVFPPGTATPAYVGRIDDRVAELGKVRAEASSHELREAVDAVLAGRPPAPAKGPAIGCYISDLR
ncbi:MAG: redoxin domain-containing protein [Myxococcales bacterium]|nr:redoxin domain-containing protein [Myxococcales bacterium]